MQAQTIGLKYAMSIENITFCGNPINTSEYTATTWGIEWPDPDNDGLWVEGFGGSSIGFWRVGTFSTPPYTFYDYNGIINAPFSYDFSNYRFLWLDDTEIPDTVEVYCTGIKQIIGGTVYDLPWHGTIAELKALGRYTQKHGCYYWSAQPPDMQAAVALYLDLTSAEAHGIDIRGPQPQYKVEAAGWTGGVAWAEGTVSPVDGPYRKHLMHNGEWAFTNGSFVMYLYDADSGDWGIGPDLTVPPYYLQSGGGPGGVYLVNTDYWADDIIYLDTGQRRFSGLAGEGIGPAVSASTDEAILVDSDCATPSFAHDATCIFDAWPLSATDRTSSPYMTDVVSIGVGSAQSVYADAHDHTDWVGDNCTTPDEDGFFTVGAGGGSLTFTPKCNYRTRQAEAKGTGNPDAIPVPTCYRDRRHDTHLGEGTVPETAEAVWDWRGMYLTQSFKLPSVPVDVVCTVRYYMDLLGVGDNHDTENVRQTDYTYSAGELYTLTRTIPVTFKYPDDYEVAIERGFSPILIDLYDEGNAGQPVAMVYDLKWEFSEAGEYRMTDPTVTPDIGDRQEPATVSNRIEVYEAGTAAFNGEWEWVNSPINGYSYWQRGTYVIYWMPGQSLWILHDEASLGNEDASGGYYVTSGGAVPVTATAWTVRTGAAPGCKTRYLDYREQPYGDGLEVKVLEASTYSQGIVSAHHNGFANMALFVPDNAKGNSVERTFDTLNVLYGEELDFTSNYALAAWPLTNTGELFTKTHSQAAEDAHMVDEDDVRLKTLNCYDISPQAHGSGDLNVAVRCYQINCVAGLPYTFYGAKYVGGQGHGMLLSKAAYEATGQAFPRKRGAGVTGKLYRRPLGSEDDGEWALVGGGYSGDEHGHYKTGAHEISGDDAERTIYEYAILQAGEYVSFGRFATREFALLQVHALTAFRDTHMCREWPLGNVWLIAENGEGNCLVYYIDAGASNIPVECKTHPFTSGVHRRPSIAVCSWGWIYACATNTQTGNMEIAVSQKGGDTWEAPVATLGSGLQYGTIWHHRGSIRLCGWADDKVYLASASAADLVRETLDGTNELIEVAAYTVTDDAIPVTSVVVREDGEDLVAVGDASGTAIYGSRNYREGFDLYS